jgi:LPXTG-site transpeptidase (sortase) family protein
MLKKSQMKSVFYFLAIFLVLFTLLYVSGLVPKTIRPEEGDSLGILWDKAQKEAIKEQLARGVVIGEEPTRVVIDKIKLDAYVINPSTTNIDTLNDYLNQGVVRYPGSGLSGLGNMYIFGHSCDTCSAASNLYYRIFTHLRELEVGDIISIFSATKKYSYRVTSVRLVNKDATLVEFGQTKNMLTLSTCNTLGAKDERYVVEADYVQ